MLTDGSDRSSSGGIVMKTKTMIHHLFCWDNFLSGWNSSTLGSSSLFLISTSDDEDKQRDDFAKDDVVACFTTFPNGQKDLWVKMREEVLKECITDSR